jgi:hypothetical protein
MRSPKPLILRSERSEASKERRFCKGPASGRVPSEAEAGEGVRAVRVRVGPD